MLKLGQEHQEPVLGTEAGLTGVCSLMRRVEKNPVDLKANGKLLKASFSSLEHVQRGT